MTKEILMKMGLTEEQADAVLAEHNTSVEGLKNKNSEILGKLQTQKSAVTESESELEVLRQFKQNKELEEAESKSNYEDALKLVQEREGKKAKDLEQKLSTYESQLHTLIVDNKLDEVLDSVKVNPALKKAAKTMLSNQLTVKDGQAVTEDGVTLTELVKTWSETDEGKAFVLAAKNSGGGGQGSLGSDGNATDKKFSEMNSDERTALYRSNPTEYRRLRDLDKKGTK